MRIKTREWENTAHYNQQTYYDVSFELLDGNERLWELLHGKIWEWDLRFRWEWQWVENRNKVIELVQKIYSRTSLQQTWEE